MTGGLVPLASMVIPEGPWCHGKYLQLPPDSQRPMRLTVLTSRLQVSQLHWMEYHNRMKAEALGTPCFLHQQDQRVDGDEKLFFFLLGVRGKEVRSNCHRNASWTKKAMTAGKPCRTPHLRGPSGEGVLSGSRSTLILSEAKLYGYFMSIPASGMSVITWQCEVLS